MKQIRVRILTEATRPIQKRKQKLSTPCLNRSKNRTRQHRKPMCLSTVTPKKYSLPTPPQVVLCQKIRRVYPTWRKREKEWPRRWLKFMAPVTNMGKLGTACTQRMDRPRTGFWPKKESLLLGLGNWGARNNSRSRTNFQPCSGTLGPMDFFCLRIKFIHSSMNCLLE